MAKISWRMPLTTLQSRIENIPQDCLERAVKIMNSVVEDGADLMREYIATRGTEKSGKVGRIESGSMFDAVETNVTVNPRSVRGEFGWGVNGGKDEDYFSYQDNGFQHWVSGENVPPMHALLDAKIKMREEFFRRVRREFGARR